jgi:hypothetical protein
MRLRESEISWTLTTTMRHNGLEDLGYHLPFNLLKEVR